MSAAAAEATGLVVSPQNVGVSVYDRITDPLGFVDAMGKSFAQAGVGGAKNEAQGKCLALACLCKRMDPFEFSSQYHLIDGKPTLQAHVILARIRQAGGRHRWIKDGEDAVEAVGEFTLDGHTTTVAYKLADAHKQGLVKGGSAWDKTPAAMLRAAVVRKAAKMLCPEILIGDVDPEEFASDPVPASTPARSVDEVAKRRAELLASSTTVEAEHPKEEPPFDANATAAKPADSSGDLTTILLEIEATISQVGMTTAGLEAALKAKSPDFKGLDSLSVEGAQKLLANLREKIAKK